MRRSRLATYCNRENFSGFGENFAQRRNRADYVLREGGLSPDGRGRLHFENGCSSLWTCAWLWSAAGGQDGGDGGRCGHDGEPAGQGRSRADLRGEDGRDDTTDGASADGAKAREAAGARRGARAAGLCRGDVEALGAFGRSAVAGVYRRLLRAICCVCAERGVEVAHGMATVGEQRAGSWQMDG